MTKLTLYGDMKTMALNPWRETKYGKSTMYIRAPAPWDNRKQGKDGLSALQRKATTAFTLASKSAAEVCPVTGLMSTNICRIEHIKASLEGNDYSKAEWR